MSFEKASEVLRRFGLNHCQTLVCNYKCGLVVHDDLKKAGIEPDDIEDLNKIILPNTLRVYNIMTRGTLEHGLLTIWQADTIDKAAGIMAENGVSSLIVVELGKPVGLITERDIVQKVVGKKKKLSVCRVSYYMSAPIITIDYNESLDKAAYLMSTKTIKKLVVTRDDKIVGIVTTTDFVLGYREILKKLVDVLKKEKIGEMKPEWK